MNKFVLSITAHVGDNVMCVFEQEFADNITKYMHELPIYSMVTFNMPCVKWSFDDGEDKTGTNYCQYVCYTGKEKGKDYLLASWNEIDEKGFVVL